MKLPLTVVIASKNCEDRIKGTVSPWREIATEIIVVDQNSDDKTALIAKEMGCTVISNDPPFGNFDLNRKLGIERAKSEWILYIDTDERPTRELLDEIKKFLTSGETNKTNGVRIPNLFYFLGKPLRHGIYNPRSAEIRMFRSGKWKYPCEEGYHRGISVDGSVIKLKSHYKHFNVNSIAEWFIKTNQYTEHDALKFYKLRSSTVCGAFVEAGIFFVRHYFFKCGFLDGFHGLVAVFYFMLYHLTLKIKIWEKQTLDKMNKEVDYLDPIKIRER